MILRRVIAHFRNQEWTAIFIDFVIVVLGVFVGIQVANWNEQRVEDHKAQAYLARIRGNLDSDLQSIHGRQVFWARVNDYGKQAIHYAETGERVEGSAWKTVLAFYQASQLWQWRTSDSTYQEMRSGGELGLIRDNVLRDALSQYYLETGSASDYLFYLQPEYRKLVRGLTPSVVADYIWAKCWSQPSPLEQHLLDCEAPISEEAAQAVLEGYLGDPKLLPELRFWVANQIVVLNVVKNYTVSLNEMLPRATVPTAP
ncbi:MAG: hypothetical protein EYC71_02910 [Gammaproteobacteria bacterium]|nr:MAG: hypothetical protein EYC71_02910 [Gammaproteobacteria bacterium]